MQCVNLWIEWPNFYSTPLTILSAKIISSKELPGGTIGITLLSLSMINSITVGTLEFCFAAIKACSICASFSTRIPYAP